MATIDSFVHERAFRNAHCYAPESIMSVLRGSVGAHELVLVVDVDTLERSALARIDRVMMLALDALARARVQVVLVARYEQDRAALLQQRISSAKLVKLDEASLTRLRDSTSTHFIALSNDPLVLAQLQDGDGGIALGRPELAAPNVVSIGDVSVRATLWWMLEERVRVTSP
jgi:hypothetical protein